MAVKIKKMNEEDNKTQSKQPGESSLYKLLNLVNMVLKENYLDNYDIVLHFMMS